MNIYKRNSYIRDIVLIDGMMRQAKSLHGPLVSSFQRCEMWNISPFIDSISYLNYLKLINDNVAEELLTRELDQKFYYGLLGRNVNFRKKDVSSIWKFKKPLSYQKRLNIENEYEILNNYISKKTNEIFVLMTHDFLANPKSLFTKFPKIRVLWSRRHPVFVTNSWYQKKWPSRIGKDKFSLALSFIGKEKKPLPWFMKNSSNDYLNANLKEKTVLSYHNILKLEKKSYAKFKNKIFIKPFFFESCVTNKNKYLDDLKVLIKTSSTKFTKDILIRERVPRNLTMQEYQKKYNLIMKNISKKYQIMFVKEIENYENDFFLNEGFHFKDILK